MSLVYCPKCKQPFELTSGGFSIFLKNEGEIKMPIVYCPKCKLAFEGTNEFDKHFCSKIKEPINDNVNHPKHYTSHKSGVECIQITEHMSFTLGNAIKYIWRADLKNGVEDLKKARWYIDREITKREGKLNGQKRSNDS